MQQIQTELKTEIQKSLARMRRLRDEVRVRVHFADVDAIEEWEALLPRLAHVERAAKDCTETSFRAISDCVRRLSKLRSLLS